MKLSLVIPAKDKNDPKLADLLRSIQAQDFPKDEMETLVITEGTSESAKAIGIRRATGEVIGILASDNVLSHDKALTHYMRFCNKDVAKKWFGKIAACYPTYYEHDWKDDALNRYFALIGGNDPLAFYMKKNDRLPYWYRGKEFPKWYWDAEKAIGDNGFFIKKEFIESTDLENYYHIDNANEAVKKSGLRLCGVDGEIKHNTGGNIFKFFAKRYRYGLQHAFNKNRRWHLVDFRQPKDILRLIWFVFCAITILEPLCLSIKGYLKIKDMAWFLHPIVCLMTIFTYGGLVANIMANRLYQLLSAPMAARTA